MYSISDIRLAVKEAAIGTQLINFPLKSISDDEPRFETANGEIIVLSALGAGYISEKVKGVSYATCTALWRDKKYEQLAALTSQIPGSAPYVAAFYKGEVVGMMTNYCPVSHETILKQIEDANLEGRIVSFSLSSMTMEIGLGFSDAIGTDDYVKFNMRISNGHSGHYALRYYAALQSGAFVWSQPFTESRRRHLSKVGDVLGRMKETYDAIAAVELDVRLRSIPRDEAFALVPVTMTVNEEKLMDAVGRDKSIANGLDLVNALVEQSFTRGFKSAVVCLVDTIIDSVYPKS